MVTLSQRGVSLHAECTVWTFCLQIDLIIARCSHNSKRVEIENRCACLERETCHGAVLIQTNEFKQHGRQEWAVDDQPGISLDLRDIRLIIVDPMTVKGES